MKRFYVAVGGRRMAVFFWIAFNALIATVAIFLEATVLPGLDTGALLAVIAALTTAGSVFVAGESIADARRAGTEDVDPYYNEEP